MSHQRRRVALALGSLALSAVPAAAQAEVLVATGDLLAGLGTVDEIYEVAIDEGGSWLAVVHTDSLPVSGLAVLHDGVVVLKYGDPIPGSQPGTTFIAARSVRHDGAGGFDWVAGHPASPLSGASGTYSNLTPVALYGDVVVAAGITPGTTINGVFDQLREPSGSLLVHVTANDVAIPGIVDNMILRMTPLVGGGYSSTVVVKRGDVLPGQTSGIQELSETSHGMATNAAGELAYMPRLQSGPTAVYLDQTLLAQSGLQSPVFGRIWSSLFRMPVALNDAGDFAFGGRLSGDIESDHILIWNGIKMVQEGDGLDSIAPFSLTELGIGGSVPGPLRLSDFGAAMWYGAWDDPDPKRNSGLFIDHELVVQEGETWIDGAVVEDLTESTNFAPRPVFDATSDFAQIAFRARLTDGRIGAFRIHPAGSVTTLPGCAPYAGILSSAAPPKVGGGFLIALQGAQADGALGLAFLSLQLAPQPCGTPLPGIGDLLISLAPPDLFRIQAGLFPAIGGQTFFVFPAVPQDPQLFGLTFHAQGLWVDVLGSTPLEPLRLSNGLTVSIGK